jgi:glycosyltransferase involved in cell wall biosynthesis
VISALRGAGVEVDEHHVDVWEGREHKFASGAGAAARVLAAQARLLRRPRGRWDAVIVGYPGQLDVLAARRLGVPLVLNPLVSLWDTVANDRARFAPTSLHGRALKAVDRLAFSRADVVVADTEQHAALFRELGARRTEVALVGAEERLFSPAWSRAQRFAALFVGKLIPLHGLETVVAAARLAPEIPFRIVGSGQAEDALRDAPANIERVAWVDYSDLRDEYARCGCALGIFGTSAKAARVIPNKVFQALAVGAPVVTADTPAARELLDDDTAVLVPAGDAAALAAAVRALDADAERQQAVAAAGRARYVERASEAVLGQRWRAILESVA